MTTNFTDSVDDDVNGNGHARNPEWYTVVAMFEDDIDARQTLNRLRKAECPSAATSVLVHDRRADEGGPLERHWAVARAVHDAGLDSLADWLTGLASVIIPERGTFLVAGPIGAALAGLHVEADDDEPEAPSATIVGILTQLGFSSDEAAYIDSRAVADAVILGVTSNDPATLESARQTFAAENAVHIGQARTDEQVALAATQLLHAAPEDSGDGDVVVIDAVARFCRLCESERADEFSLSLRGSTIIDSDGNETAELVEFLAETIRDGDNGAERDELRYVVVRHGGVLGIGKRYAAIPLDQIDLSTQPVRVAFARDVLQRAPVYDNDAPFSRREEHAICAFFGTRPYWADESPAP